MALAAALVALAASGCGGSSSENDTQAQSEVDLPEPTIYDYGWFCMTQQVVEVADVAPALDVCMSNANGKPESEANPYRSGAQDAFNCFTTPTGETRYVDWLNGTGPPPSGCTAPSEYMRRVVEAEE